MTEPSADDLFTCERCGGTFPKGWSDEEAEAATVDVFGAMPDPGDRAVICEDCWVEFVAWYLAQQTLRPVWEPDRGLRWSVIDGGPDPARPCRYTFGPGKRQCKAPSVAVMNRASDPAGNRPFAYCADHLYGRRIVGGRIWQTILVREDP